MEKFALFCGLSLLIFLSIASSHTSFAEDIQVINDLQTDVTITKDKVTKNETDIENLKGGLPAEVAARKAADEAMLLKINNMRGQVCVSGSFVYGIDLDGNILCAELPGAEIQKIVFVSGSTFTGKLSGISGADQICNNLASAAGLPGTYKAWLSDSVTSPSTTFKKSTVPYVLSDKTTIVANDWADLIDGTLAHSIDMDEKGTTVDDSNGAGVWTGTSPDGNANPWSDVTSPYCDDWTTDVAYSNGSPATGWFTSMYASWTLYNSGYANLCNNFYHVYCFQQ